MTTICAFKDGGRWHLTADSRVVSGYDFDDTFQKIRRYGNFVFAIAGDAAAFIRLAKHPEPDNEWELVDAFKAKEGDGSASMFAITRDGKQFFRLDTNGFMQELTKGKHHAIGSGADILLGALDAGKTIKEAFNIVKARDLATGGPIVSTLGVRK